MYYLQSRYYNPTWGRFISADNYPSTGQGLTGNNMFAYCGNNPVSRSDNSGEFWVTAVLISALVAGVISAVADAAIQAATTGEVDAGQVLIAGVSGAISGAAGNLFRFSSTGAIRNAGETLVNKGMQKMTNGVLNSATSTIKRGFQYVDRGISMIYQYAARAGVNSGFGSTTGCVINGIYSLIG